MSTREAESQPAPASDRMVAKHRVESPLDVAVAAESLLGRERSSGAIARRATRELRAITRSIDTYRDRC